MQRRRRGGGTAAGGTGSGIVYALLYPRVSGAEQEKEGYSLPSQLTDLRRYVAERDGWAIGGEFPEVMTGKRADRPQYQAMLAEARRLRAEGHQVVIVAKWLHRLGRNMRESVERRDELKALGVAIHSVMEGGEVSDFMAHIMASVAQYESDQLGERVSEVREYLRVNGWKAPGRVAWGFRWREATPEEVAEHAPKKVLAVDPVTAPYAIEAWGHAAAGMSVQALSRWIARLPEAARGGRNMSFNAVREMLAAPVYTGRYYDAEGQLHTGRWPRLIEDATFARVQERLAAHATMPRQATGRFLLTGLLRCANPDCGSRMAGHSRGKENRGPSYACMSWAGGAAGVTGCRAKVLAAPVEAAVTAAVEAVVVALLEGDPALRATMLRIWREYREPAYADEALTAVRRLEAEQRRAKQRLSTAAIKLIDGELDKAGYDAAKARVERDLAAAEAALVRLREAAGRTRPELPELDAVLAVLGGWRGAIAAGDVLKLRDVLGFLLRRVVAVRIVRGKYDVRIDWTPAGEAARDLAAELRAAA